MISLVTGASGFVGSHVARFLAARGGEVRLLMRPSSDLRAIEGIPAERFSGDLRDPASLKAVLRGVDRVYHVAADYRLWSKTPKEIYESNVEGAHNLLQAAREAGVSRFVYTSTVGTIAAPVASSRLPNEETLTRLDQMIGHYKRSKFLGEQEALRAAREGMSVVIVNPTTPVGAGDWKPTPTGQLIVDFLNGKTPAYVDTGLNIVGVEDVAEGHLLAAERGRAGERYLLGAENMTLLEIFTILAKFSGRPAPRWKIPYSLALAAGYCDAAVSAVTRREPRIPLEGVRMARHKMFADCSKAVRELGFRPGPAAQALGRAAQWYIGNGYVRE
ncbi:MAG: hopanoid-associated sugar epimerase [Terriglobia bacterium]